MTICIICRCEKDKMSDEHVIPDSLGGYYHLHTVCEDCNSHLGTKVDTHLINNKLGELYRSKFSLKGKKGKIPNPLGGVFTNESNENLRLTYRKNNDNTLTPHLFPYHELQFDCNGNVSGLTLALDESDYEKKEEIIAKFLKRKGIDNYEIQEDETRKEKISDYYKASWGIDFDKIKIGALKIAYEFAVDKVKDYFNDKDAIKISKILLNADIDSAGKYVNIGDGINKNIIKPFESFLDTEKNTHYLILTQAQDKLICIIRINEVYLIGVTLSHKKYFDFTDSLVGVNSLEKKSFYVTTLKDAFNENQGPVTLKFFYKKNEICEKGVSIEPIDHNEYHGKKDMIPLYSKDGTCIAYLHEYLENTPPTQLSGSISKIGSQFINPIQTKGREFYVQSKKTNNLFKIDSVELSQNWKKLI
jgi:hypothetical protein